MQRMKPRGLSLLDTRAEIPIFAQLLRLQAACPLCCGHVDNPTLPRVNLVRNPSIGLAQKSRMFMPRLTEQEQQEVIRYIEADKPFPDKYRFLLRG